MSDQPLISVVIPSYNSARFVGEAVQSALAQTYAPVEVIVVDDGSTDDTRARLAPWDGAIRYVRQANGGVAKARNRGIQEARGDLIAFLDADDQWLPDKLAKQADCLRVNPECGLVHADIWEVREAGGERVQVDTDRNRFSGRCYLEFFWSNCVTTSSVVVTRRCLEQVGAFDEQIRGASTEDKDLWLRIARAFPLAYVDEPLVLYRLHAANVTHNRCKMAEDEYYVLAKALESDTQLAPALGWPRVRRWMADLAFQAGYGNADRGDLRRARRYFRAALGHAPQRVKTWAFWASTFLPQTLRRPLRFVKQRLGL